MHFRVFGNSGHFRHGQPYLCEKHELIYVKNVIDKTGLKYKVDRHYWIQKPISTNQKSAITGK